MSITLRPYQTRLVEYFEKGGRYAVQVAHRRAGKDLTALHIVKSAALLRPGGYWYALPSYSQARRVCWEARWEGRRLLDVIFPPGLVAKRNEVAMSLTFHNGSFLQFVGSDQVDSLVGSNPLGVVFSEAALSRAESWRYISPIVKQNQGFMLWISTPRGKGPFYELYEHARSDPSWYADLLDIHTTGAIPATVLEEERRAGMPESMVRSEYLCDFTGSQVGSVYGDLLDKVRERGGIHDFPVKDAADVYVNLDLGISDATAAWFWTVVDGKVSFIDYHEGSGKALHEHLDIITSRGYKLKRVLLPHDARARSLAVGVTTAQLAEEQLGRIVTTLPVAPVAQGIEAMRALLYDPGTRFHATNCKLGLEALEAYRYEWSEELKTFSRRPVHDHASNGSDAARYAAWTWRTAVRWSAPKPGAPEPRKEGFAAMKLDDLFADHEREKARRVRI